MKCEHITGEQRFLGLYTNIPTKNSGPTQFNLFRCDCGEVIPSNQKNFDLLSEETKKEILLNIKDQ